MNLPETGSSIDRVEFEGKPQFDAVMVCGMKFDEAGIKGEV